MPNDYFPPQTGGLKDFDVWDAHRKAYEMIHDLRREVEKLKAAPPVTTTPQPQTDGASNTKINGLFIKAVPPKNGEKLTYNSSTGQIEWQ